VIEAGHGEEALELLERDTRVDCVLTELQMPVWSPGRYAKMDFARNVQEFSAVELWKLLESLG